MSLGNPLSALTNDRAVLGFENLLDAEGVTFTINTGSAVTDYPLSNLAEPELDLAHRARVTPGAGDVVQIEFDLGATELAMQGFALVLHNLCSTDTARIYTYTSGVWTSRLSPTACGAVRPWPNNGDIRNMFVYIHPTEVMGNKVRFEFDVTGSTSATSYIEAARAYVGPIWNPSNNFDYGYSMRVADETEFGYTVSRVPHRFGVAPTRQCRMQFQCMSEAEAVEGLLQKLDYGLGRRGDLLICPRPGGDNFWFENLWGYLLSTEEVSLPQYNLWSRTLTFEERRA